jgi:hypothetical protein
MDAEDQNRPPSEPGNEDRTHQKRGNEDQGDEEPEDVKSPEKAHVDTARIHFPGKWDLTKCTKLQDRWGTCRHRHHDFFYIFCDDRRKYEDCDCYKTPRIRISEIPYYQSHHTKGHTGYCRGCRSENNPEIKYWFPKVGDTKDDERDE